MNNLNKSVKIDPQFTAEEWQLYTATRKCKKVANSLNKSLRTLVNNGCTKIHVHDSMITIMHLYSEYGATDTEPRWFLNAVLDQVYNQA